jgi:hypothetical protein
MRRFVAERFGGYNEPQGKAAAYGTKVHKVGENWFDGIDPNPNLKPDALFMEFIPHIPSRTLTGEYEILFKADGIQFRGFSDFIGVHEGVLWVGDFKTSSRPYEYGLTTEEAMHEDEQVNIYTLAAMVDFKFDESTALWLYGDTSKNRFAFPSKTSVTYTQAEDYMADKALPRAREMHAAADEYSRKVTEGTPERVKLQVLNEIPCDPTECNWRQFNCGFKGHCSPFTGRVKSTNTETQEEEDDNNPMAKSLKEIIEENKRNAQAAQVKESATPAEPSALPPEAKEALPTAVEDRNLPAKDQDLGRKENEKNEKAEAKAAKEAEKEAKKAAKEAEKEAKASKAEPSPDVRNDSGNTLLGHLTTIRDMLPAGSTVAVTLTK